MTAVEQPEGGRDELADLRAEVERLTEALSHAQVREDALRTSGNEWMARARAAEADQRPKDAGGAWNPTYRERWEGVRAALTKQEQDTEFYRAERDDALARLAEAEGVARTNAAWVQHWHAAAKEAREQRDALQRQVEAVRYRVMHGPWWTIDGFDLVPVAEVSAALGDSAAPTPEPADVRATLAHLDGTPGPAVQALTGLTAAELDDLGGVPADQPHPTPEAHKCHGVGRCEVCGAEEPPPWPTARPQDEAGS